MKTLPFLVAACLFGICTSQEQGNNTTNDMQLARLETSAGHWQQKLPEIEDVGAGDYLSSLFAQQNHDWKNANKFITPLLNKDPKEMEVMRRAMVLAMGAGDTETAIQLAHKIKEDGKDPSLSVAQIFLISDAIARDDSKQARTLINELMNDTTANFVRPFLEGWVSAGEGKLKIESLKENTVQLYHAILISDFLNDHSQLEKILTQSISIDNANPADIERIADLYAHSGIKNKAIELYKQIQKDFPTDSALENKIKDVQNGTNKPLFEKVASAKQGMAIAFHDIAEILFQDYNDESSRIFANMALMLMPDMTENIFLLANISARHDQYEEAIGYYRSIPESEDANYLNAQFKITELLEESGKSDAALNALKALEKNHDNIEIQINIGDLQRRQKNYSAALESYNKAIAKLGSPLPPQYWHLHYARGICYEQSGDWPAAETELKAALALQPDHPYVLNYLGYGWADQGINLNEAQTMIQKAVDLRPSDGYIVDSLGWVMYRTGNYTQAVPNLEKAVALLPYDPTINDHLGDAYWKVGRKREARFQWERAKNHSKDQKQIDALAIKLSSGLAEKSEVLGANNQK